MLGSSSLLASYPDMGEVGGSLETSYDADLLIEGVDEELAAIVQEAIGKESLFEAREGYYADTLRPLMTETLPRDWEKRLIPLPGFKAVGCLDPHDLAAVKMQAGRPKDVALCAALLAAGRLNLALIRERLEETRMSDRVRALASERLKRVIEMAGP